MVMDSVMARFAERAPITVMARLALQRALDSSWIDSLFEKHRHTQYTRELLFSTTVEIMSVVAVGLRPSVHAAAKAYLNLPVSITALYDKINRTDPEVVRALIQGSNERLEPVLQAMRQDSVTSVDGYRLRIIDGNHLLATEKRLKPLRQFRGAALPGHSLVVYDPDTGLVIDLLPCEDAHAQRLHGPDPGARPCRRAVYRRSQFQYPSHPDQLASARQRLHRARACRHTPSSGLRDAPNGRAH